MKKVLLLSLSLCASMAMSAKELTFTFNDETVAAGSTIEFDKYETYAAGDDQVEVFIEPKIYITKDSEENVSIKTTANYPVQLCIGGQCEAEETILKNNLSFPVDTPTDLLLDCSLFFNKDESIVLPQIEVLIEAWYTESPNEVTSITLLMGDTAGVADAANAVEPLTVNGKTLTYNGNETTDIVVYNLCGQAVCHKRVQGSGSISLDSLSAGIYLYRTSGSNSAAGKFIIR